MIILYIAIDSEILFVEKNNLAEIVNFGKKYKKSNKQILNRVYCNMDLGRGNGRPPEVDGPSNCTKNAIFCFNFSIFCTKMNKNAKNRPFLGGFLIKEGDLHLPLHRFGLIALPFEVDCIRLTIFSEKSDGLLLVFNLNFGRAYLL